MFRAEIREFKLLCGDFVHGGTGISGRTYLVGVKLFPPVQRGGDVHSDKNLPEILSVRVSCRKQLSHKGEVVLTDFVAVIRCAVMLFRVADTLALDTTAFAAVNGGVTIRPVPTVQGISHTTDSVFKSPSLNAFYLNHWCFLLPVYQEFVHTAFCRGRAPPLRVCFSAARFPQSPPQQGTGS